jgi:hypothetical protein
MTTKLKTGALAMVLLVLLGLVVWQHQQIKLLRTKESHLREQLAGATSLREENERLVQQLKKAGEDSQAARREQTRLRGQLSRLHQVEQENAQLRAERTRMATEATQARPVAAAAAEPQPRVAPVEVAPSASSTGVTDLGAVEFSDRVPQRLTLGVGKECIATATALADGNLQMNFTSTSEIDGVPIQSERTLRLPPGKQIGAVIDGMDITLTPTLKAK